MPYTKSPEDGVGFQGGDTSLKAAAEIQPKAGTLRAEALACVKEYGPISTDGIAMRTGHDYGSIQPRLSELRAAGKVTDSGIRGKTRHGKSCIMWVAVEEAGAS